MKKHTKKIIAPVIITVMLIGWLLIYGLLAALSIELDAIGIIFLAIAVIGITAAIYTLVERIHEIKDGEEDDISKY